MVDFIIGPDVFVNASVAPNSPPEHVIRRTLGPAQKAPTTDWILTRTRAMLAAIDSFKKEAIEPQMDTLKQYVEVFEADEHGPDAWEGALVAAAKAAKVSRVVTDHPDLADKTEVEGVEFLSTEAWLVEVTTPPPPPGS